jgi:hypothetical protein
LPKSFREIFLERTEGRKGICREKATQGRQTLNVAAVSLMLRNAVFTSLAYQDGAAGPAAPQVRRVSALP